MLEKTLEISLLYDFYGELLTERQRYFIELYYHHDLSLGEIAAQTGVTRQAVYDLLRRAERSLRGYEKVLGLVAQHRRRRAALRRCRELLDQLTQRARGQEDILRVTQEVRRILQEELG